MPFNSGGVFSRVYNWVTDATNGIPMTASRFDSDANDMAAGLSNCITRNGQSPATANLPMGGFKLTGLGQGSAAGDSITYDQISGSNGSSAVGFIQAGTGAVPRTLQSKVRDRVNGLDFGIKADGTTDDTAALQAAINYVLLQSTIGNSTWGYLGPVVLELPPGYIKISAAININARITIRGAGSSEFSSGTRIVQTAANTDTFKFVATGGGASFEISDVTFTTSGAGAAVGSGHQINVQPGTPGFNSNRIYRCCFTNPQNMAIRIAGDDYQITDCTWDVSGLSGHAIQLGSNTTGDVASDVTITNPNFFNVPVDCIQHFNAFNVRVINPQMSQLNGPSTTLSFYEASGTAPILCKGVSITGGVLYGARRIFGGSNVSDITITGLCAYACGVGAGETADAILLGAGSTNANINISGVLIQGSYGAKSAFNNQANAGSTNVNVNGCTFVQTGGTGVGLIAGAMTGNIGGNVYSGWATKATASDLLALNYQIPGQAAVTYSASITPDASQGTNAIIVVSNTTAFTINAPLNPSNGQQLTVMVYNNSGGAMGTITWNAIFHMNAFTNPATARSQSITFVYSVGLGQWYEVTRTSASVPG